MPEFAALIEGYRRFRLGSYREQRERYDRLMRRQQTISLEVNRRWIGRSLDVLVEEQQEGAFVGRSFRDAPEIDGLVYVSGDAGPGEIVPTRITDAAEYDLYADRVGGSPDRAGCAIL